MEIFLVITSFSEDMKDKKLEKEVSIGCGALLAFGFPLITWIFYGWKWALVIFIAGQTLIFILKLLVTIGQKD